METFYNTFIAGKKNILIPALQRDYVQASDDNLSEGIISNLVHDMYEATCGKKVVDLNYIYGYSKNGCFIPIDGQQRLTTLWLFHLYLRELCHRSDDFPLLEYMTREYAKDFFCELQHPGRLFSAIENAHKREHSCSLREEIEEHCAWFIPSWKYDISIESALNALSVMDSLYPISWDAKDLWKSIEQTECINFTFMEMEGINTDLYIKMNGRGRPLSEFEKIKSWLDNVVDEKGEKTIELSDIREEWKSKMDNEWQDLFWDNRNKSQKHQEEIDDEELRMFYNLLYLYWMRNKNRKFIDDSTEDGLYQRKQLAGLLEIENHQEIESILMSRMGRETEFSLPLYVLQKTNLVTKDFIRWFYNAMNGIVGFKDEINALPQNIKVGSCNLDVDDDHTFIYRLFMDDAASYKLCLEYAIIIFCTSPNTMFLDSWMRVWKNLILNSSISSESLANALNTIESYSGVDIIKVMQECSPGQSFNAKGFNSTQITEETKKAKLLYNPVWETPIYEAEQCHIFRGAIRNLFERLEIDSYESLDNFKNRCSKALSYFERSEKNEFYNAGQKTFRTKLICALISQCDWDQLWELWICRTVTDWRDNIINTKLHSALLSFWDMKEIKEDGRENLSRITFENQNKNSVLKDLCFTKLIRESIKAAGASVYLHGIDTEYSGRKYYITSFNAKADWKKYFIGTERNRILNSLLEDGTIKMASNNQKIGDMPFFWGYNINFICKGQQYCWSFHDELKLYLGEEEWSPLLARGTEAIEEYIRNLSD